MKKWGLLLAALVILPAYSEESQEAEKFDEYSMVETFVECAGLYESTAKSMGGQGKPAVAEHMHNMANGAKTAAAWTLWTKWHEDNPTKPPRRLGEWSESISVQADSQTARFAAMEEIGDWDYLKTRWELCTEVSKVQADIIRSLRKTNGPSSE